jgi:hypothetical protein
MRFLTKALVSILVLLCVGGRPVIASSGVDLLNLLSLLGKDETTATQEFSCTPRLISGNSSARIICHSKVLGSIQFKSQSSKISEIMIKASPFILSREDAENQLLDKCQMKADEYFKCEAGHEVSLTDTDKGTEIKFCHKFAC